MNAEQQQDLFGIFQPEAGVHKAPPVSVTSFTPAKEEIVFQRSAKARGYRLTLKRDGTAVATIPLRGSEREARRFVEQQQAWLERARERQRRRPRGAEVWTIGTHILWRGELTEVRIAANTVKKPQVCL